MLSPNATKRVAARRGTLVTDTEKLHAAVCCFASRAVHVTGVVPTEKFEPVPGAQLTVTGASPPVTLGAP
jgi:hypothetical protein